MNTTERATQDVGPAETQDAGPAETAPPQDDPTAGDRSAGADVAEIPHLGPAEGTGDGGGADEQPPPPARVEGRVAACWLPGPALERLAAVVTVDAVESPGAVEGADLVVVSTRAPRPRAIPLARRLRESGTTFAVVCHPGGEHVALELVRAGATAVVAEGNEAALTALLEPTIDPPQETLLLAFEQHQTGLRSGTNGGGGSDPATGLPAEDAFAARLRELDQQGTPVRVGLVEIRDLERATVGLDPHARGILRRRLGVLFRGLADQAGAALYTITPSRFAFIGSELPAERVHQLGLELIRAAEAFAPDGTFPLRVAVGHAGPEVGGDAGHLARLAERALEAAATGQGSTILNAEDLSTSSATSLEPDLALRMVTQLSELDGYPGSHSHRVADLAAELARQLGYEGRDLGRIRLSGLLHDIGKVGLPPEAMRGPEGLEGASLEAYRTHPVRGARYAHVAAGRAVAEAVRAHHERFDGTGFPDGLAAEDIPMAARIVAVADAFDRLRCTPDPDGVAPSPAACLERLREGAGTQFDPAVVEAAELAALD